MRETQSPEPNGEIEVTPYSDVMGAEVRGVDLARGADGGVVDEVRRALLAHQVLFFKDQSEISPARHVEFGRQFGALHAHPAAPTMPGYPEIFEIHTNAKSRVANGEFWHSDVSCDEEPPLGTMLQLHVLPPRGGDTLFATMYAAYDALSADVQQSIDGLAAWHESAHIYRGRYRDRGRSDDEIACPTALHPIVRTHPETGRKALYVNRTFTTRVDGLSDAESDDLLERLFQHIEQERFQIRFRWSQNDMAFWDNRCCLHHAVWDYWPAERRGRRVTIRGDRPR